MGYFVKFNWLLRLNPTFDISMIKEGATLTYTAEGERIFPLNIPIEISDSEATYLAKIVIRKLVLEKDTTTVTFEVLKMFTPEESKVYTETRQ